MDMDELRNYMYVMYGAPPIRMVHMCMYYDVCEAQP